MHLNHPPIPITIIIHHSIPLYPYPSNITIDPIITNIYNQLISYFI